MVDAILDINWVFYKNLLISDINKKARQRVCNFMLEYIQSNNLIQILYKSNDNKVKETNWLKIINHILENDCSIMVTDQITGEIKAVALLQWITQEWRTWTATRLMVSCPVISDLLELMHQIFVEYEEGKSQMQTPTLHIYFFHINEDLLSDYCFKKSFFDAIREVARHMKMTQVAYVALSNYDRTLISEHNFNEVGAIMYSMFVLAKRRRPFDRLRDINEMNATLFVQEVEPLTPYQDMIVRHGHLSTKEVSKKKERRTTITIGPKQTVEAQAEDE